MRGLGNQMWRLSNQTWRLSNQTWELSKQMLRLITAWKMGMERNNYPFLTKPRGKI